MNLTYAMQFPPQGPMSGSMIVNVGSTASSASTPSPSSPSSASNFPSDDEMKRLARAYVGERIASLKKDVDHCLREPYDPFPAILYSLATIEMLGALVKGQVSKNSPTSANTENYMMTFMHYTQEQSQFIMQIFRHKMSHLAQPNPIMISSQRTVTWQYHHEDKMLHLLLTPADKDSKIIVTSDWPRIKIDQVFHLSIRQLVDDIEYSIYGHNGLLDKLERNEDKVFDNFKTAITQIYGVQP